MMAKEDIKNREKRLLKLTRTFCTHKLDDDYFQLCEKLIKKLGRKREVPFQRGQIEIWAAAIVNAIGSVNFLFDKSFEPYVSAEEINDYFGTKKSTVSSKAKLIKKLFKMGYFNPEFSTRQMRDSNPFNSMVMVDGFIVPLDSIPEDLQELVKKERAEGKDISFTTKS